MTFRSLLAWRAGVLPIGFAATLVVSVGLVFGVLSIGEGGALAQVEGLTADKIEELANKVESQQGSEGDGTSNEPQIQRFNGSETAQVPSRLEIFYSNRAGQPLLQFGYDTFGVGRDVMSRKSGGLQENYVIGVGDVISIDLRGQENSSFRVTVDDSGRVILPKLDPISAAGRRLGDFRAQLENQISKAYIATNVYVSIQDVRQVTVLLSGEVNSPGPLSLSGLSTVIDALALSGGVKKSGSLRNITVFRGKDAISIDLYAIMLGAPIEQDFSLQEGDRIHVAPLGPTVAVSGWVKNPGIYELRGSTGAITAGQMIDLAGGYEVRGQYGLSLLKAGREGLTVTGVSLSKTMVASGDLLLVEPMEAAPRGGVRFTGNIRQEGLYALAEAPTVGGFLRGGSVFGDDTYSPFAIVVRTDPVSKIKRYLPFSPLEILEDTRDVILRENDVVRFFSREEVVAIAALLAAEDEEGDMLSASAVLQDGTSDDDASDLENALPTADLGSKRLEAYIHEKADKPEEQRMVDQNGLEYTQYASEKPKSPEEFLRDALKASPEGYKLDLTDPALLNLFRESRISVFGAVQSPGEYFAMDGISLGQILQIAGGLSVRADLSSIEVTTTLIDTERGVSKTDRQIVTYDKDAAKNFRLHQLDVIRIREVYSDRVAGNVTIEGEVRYPGQFDLLRGEKLSSVLQRAGGLTQNAYPYGAVFTRQSAAVAERAARNELISKMEDQLATIVATGNIEAQSASVLAEMIARLKAEPTVGRIAIEADPAVLIAQDVADITLEPGDRLIIPPRPSSITVVGEVLKSSNYQFDPKLDARDYIKLAGGYGPFADKKRVFVVMPDGRAQRLGRGQFEFGNKMLAPGSVIVVPRNMRPFQWEDFFSNLTQISSQLALTAASVSVVARDR